MSLLKAPDVLECAVQVTQERDEAHLRRSLIRTILELLPAQHAAIVRIDAETAAVSVAALRDSSNRGHIEFTAIINRQHAALRETLAAGQPRLIDSEGGLLHLQPVKGRGHGGELLAVQLQRTDSEGLRVLGAFGRLYSNFIRLVNESERDRLTGLLNRRSFDTRLAAAIDGADGCGADPAETAPVVPGQQRWLALFDVDHFKRINDGFGHLYGDEVLLLLARIVQRCFRDDDCSFRYGGEEFAVLVTRCNQEGARIALERLRVQVEQHNFPQVGRVTISIGFAALEPHLGPADVIGRADRALYAAKAAGRNQCISFDDMRKLLPQAEAPRVGEIELF